MLYTAKKKTTMLMYKNVICFSFPFITRNVCMSRERESDMAEMRTHRGDCGFFCETTLPFCFVLCRLKSSLVYIIFQVPMQSSWSHLPTTHCMCTCLLSSILPTQLTRHFHLGSICIAFTLGNSCIFCYAIHATYAACQKDLSISIQ